MSTVETKTIHVVYTNTDRTEGRGRQIPIHYCSNGVTAKRLAKGIGVMGAPGDIVQVQAVMIGDKWFLPATAIHVEGPNSDDLKELAREAKRVMMEAERQKVVERALALGLTPEDIERLSQK